MATTTHQITQKSKSNFASSFFFLSKDQKRAMEAVYAFCRLADDAVDEAPSVEEAKKQIEVYQEEIEKMQDSSTHLEVFDELAWATKRFQIPLQYYEVLLKGVLEDVLKNRYQNFEELCAYTYGVASIVGLMCLKIFEVEGPKAEEAAILLGRALQITNILRDVKSDALRNRLYLPLEDLKKFNLNEEDVLNLKQSAAYEDFMHFQLKRCELIYEEAFLKFSSFPRKPLLAAWMMGKIYFEILKELKKKPSISLQKKISLSKFRKLKILIQEYFHA